ncbi:hypothetical protein GCM10027089_32290 [Nocardia thraciensis]
MLADWHGTSAPCGLLRVSERAVAQALPPWRRQEWTAGRLTAHAALLLAFGYRPGDEGLLADAFGAPIIPQQARPEIALSLSHSADLTACATTDGTTAVGIDVEHIDRRTTELTPRITASRTRIRDPLLATMLWACKESAMKACRTGPFGMRDYRVALDHEARRAVVESPGCSRQVWIDHPTATGAVVATAVNSIPRPSLTMVTGDDVIALLT